MSLNAYLVNRYAPSAPPYPRPTLVEELSGSVGIGADLATAAWPYDPDPSARGPFARTGVTIGATGASGTARLTFDPSVPMQANAQRTPEGSLQEVWLYHRSEPEVSVTAAQHFGVVIEAYPIAWGYSGRVRCTVLKYTGGNQNLPRTFIDVNSDGALVIAAVGVLRWRYL